MIKEQTKLGKFSLTATILFVLFESVLYFLMHATDVGHFSEIAYLSIILATVFSFLSVRFLSLMIIILHENRRFYIRGLV